MGPERVPSTGSGSRTIGGFRNCLCSGLRTAVDVQRRHNRDPSQGMRGAFCLEVVHKVGLGGRHKIRSRGARTFADMLATQATHRCDNDLIALARIARNLQNHGPRPSKSRSWGESPEAPDLLGAPCAADPQERLGFGRALGRGPHKSELLPRSWICVGGDSCLRPS